MDEIRKQKPQNIDMRDLEETLSTVKFAPKPPPEQASVEDTMERIRAGYKRLGEDLELLERRLGDGSKLMHDVAEIVLDLTRTMGR